MEAATEGGEAMNDRTREQAEHALVCTLSDLGYTELPDDARLYLRGAAPGAYVLKCDLPLEVRVFRRSDRGALLNGR